MTKTDPDRLWPSSTVGDYNGEQPAPLVEAEWWQLYALLNRAQSESRGEHGATGEWHAYGAVIDHVHKRYMGVRFPAPADTEAGEHDD